MWNRIRFTIIMLMLCVVCSIISFNFGKEQSIETIIVEPSPIIQQEQYTSNDDMLQIIIDPHDVELIAKTLYGEARGCSTVEQSAVVWCILNRVDAGYGTIEEVITAPYQFTGYNSDHPVKGELKEMAMDVLIRWYAEKHCVGEVGRTLPDNYLWFHGDGKQNHFRDKYDGDYNTWGWDCINPYP